MMVTIVQVHQVLRRRKPCNGSWRPTSPKRQIPNDALETSSNRISINRRLSTDSEIYRGYDATIQRLDYDITDKKGGRLIVNLFCADRRQPVITN